MPMRDRYWAQSTNYPLYETSHEGEVRKIGSEFDHMVPQFWGRLDHGEPRWLITIYDEERGRDVTVPEEDVTGVHNGYENKYENY